MEQDLSERAVGFAKIATPTMKGKGRVRARIQHFLNPWKTSEKRNEHLEQNPICLCGRRP
jgi:hypothetical protein